jgi:hypothetical protein
MSKEKNRCKQKKFLIPLLDVTLKDRLYKEEIYNKLETMDTADVEYYQSNLR